MIKLNKITPKFRILFPVLIVLAAMATLLFIFRNHPAVYPYLAKIWPDKLTVASSGRFQSDSVKETVICGDKLAYYDNDTLYNEDGWSYKLKLTTPRLLAEGDCLIAESTTDNKCVVFSGYKKSYEISEPSGIILSDVSESGYCVIASREPGYRCKVTVYNEKGKKMFRAFFGEKFITDAALSADGKKLAVCLMDVTGDEIVSTVAFYDITKEKPYSEITDNSNAYASVSFFDDGNAVAVGDKKTMGFGKSGKAEWQYSYDEASLQYFSYCDKYVVLCLKKGEQRMIMLETNGKNYSYAHEDSDIKAVAINNDAVMAVTPRKVMFFTVRGYKMAETDVSTDVKNIQMPGTGKKGMLIHNFGYETLEAD